MTDIDKRTHEDKRTHDDRPESGAASPDDAAGNPASAGTAQSRRRVLKLGALAVPAVATLSPNMAMATYGSGGWGGGSPPPGGASVSLLACTVPMPEFIDEKGFPVDRRDIVQKRGILKRRDSNGDWLRVYRGPPEGSYSGQQIKDSLSRGWNPPAGVDSDEFQAHVQYLVKVRYQQVNGAGLTCLISLTSNLNPHRA